eukprot:8126108-Pyramimonas_sp.AAC.1
MVAPALAGPIPVAALVGRATRGPRACLAAVAVRCASAGCGRGLFECRPVHVQLAPLTAAAFLRLLAAAL